MCLEIPKMYNRTLEGWTFIVLEFDGVTKGLHHPFQIYFSH